MRNGCIPHILEVLINDQCKVNTTKTLIESFADNLCPLDIQKWNTTDQKQRSIVHWNVTNNILTSYVCLVNDGIEVPNRTH